MPIDAAPRSEGSPRPRVLHVTSTLGVGGAETSMLLLLAKLDNSLMTSEVYSMTGDGPMVPRLREHGIPVTTTYPPGSVPPTGRLASVRRLIRLIQYCRATKPDILQGWLYTANAAVTVASICARIPLHGWNIRASFMDYDNEEKLIPEKVRLNKKLSAIPKWITYDSKLSLKEHEHFGFCSRPSLYMAPGFDTDRIRPDDQLRSSLRKEANLLDSDFVVGMIGRYHPIKGYAHFIAAAAQVAATVPNARFVLIGKDFDWNNEELVDLLRRHEVENRFSLLGVRTNGALCGNMFDLHVLASRSESAPNVVCETMACGVMSVTTNVGDAAYMVGDTGFVVPREDSDSLAQAIIRVASMPESDRLALGAKARDRIVDSFSLDGYVNRYFDLYRNAFRNQ